MNCELLQSLLGQMYSCRASDNGLLVKTSCLLPDFTQVSVYVVGHGDGFIVHDGGAAFNEAWLQGRDEQLVRKIAQREASRFRAHVEENSITVKVSAADWLPMAVLAVANAVSTTVRSAVDHVVAAHEAGLVQKIYMALSGLYGIESVKKEFVIEGQSGKDHKFNFAIGNPAQRILLVDAISPHHSSVAHKYTAFSDVRNAYGDAALGFAVFDKPLDPDDIALMQQVASLVPLASVQEGAKRYFQQ